MGDLQRLFRRTNRFLRSRQNRNSRRSGQPARRRLVAKQLQQLRGWPDENNACFLASPRKRRVLREKSISRVNRIHIFLERQLDDSCNVQIRLDRPLSRSHLVGFIGFEAMQAQPVFIRIDSDRANPQLVGRAQNADGNLAAVCSHHFLDRSNVMHEVLAEPRI